MAKTDWTLHDTVQPEDMNALGEEMNGHGTAISALEGRLDNAEYEEITLQPGLQVINAKKESLFRFGEMKGRTLINLVGNRGSGEFIGEWWENNATLTIDTSVKNGLASSFKLVANGVTGEHYADMSPPAVVDYYVIVEAGKYYIVTGYVKPAAGSVANIRPIIFTEAGAVVSDYSNANLITDSSKFNFSYFALQTASGSKLLTLRMQVKGENQVANFSEISVYEISATEYAALGNMTAKQIEEKYPFTLGISGVDGPYAIGYGENLLPPFYEWNTIHANARIIGPYELKHTTSSIFNEYNFCIIPVTPGAYYSLTVTNEGIENRNLLQVLDSNMQQLTPDEYDTSDTFGNGTFTQWVKTTANAKYLRIYLYPIAQSRTTGVFSNPILTLGKEPKPFKPRRDTMLALQTELHANPTDGSEPDVLFEKEGQYFKLAKWKKVILGESQEWTPSLASKGYKLVYFLHDKNVNERSSYGVKYNGKLLPEYQGIPAADKVTIDNVSSYVWISNEDSGWGEQTKVTEFAGNGSTVKFTLPALPVGFQLIPETVTARVDGITVNVTSVNGLQLTVATAPASGKILVVNYTIAYIPTSNEIKAYFLGWKMGNNADITFPAWNGSGVKVWYRLFCGQGEKHPYATGAPILYGDVRETAPTILNDLGYTPYQLLYRLAKDTVEPVVSEGALRLHEGGNLVEVGTGIVLREQIQPSYAALSGGLYGFNNPSAYTQKLKNKSNDIRFIYKNSFIDNSRWIFYKDSRNANGGAYADAFAYNFDQTASYSVTYIKLDKSPTQPITGTLAANEQAQISDLTAGVAEALQRVSVVEMKKEDKDVPPMWIVPTLLNSWTRYTTTVNPIQYYKDPFGFVHVTGVLRPGTFGTSTPVFQLPVGYRPKYQHNICAMASNSGSKVLIQCSIEPNGNVVLVGAANEWVSIDTVTFLAEQ